MAPWEVIAARAALALVWLTSTASAHAAGFWLTERGTANLSRGGANFAAPMDPSAVLTNPAALAGHEGLQLMVDGSMWLDHRSFARASDDPDSTGTMITYDGVDNGWGSLPSAGAFASYDLAGVGLAGFTLGAGVAGPPLVDREWDAEGPQRYNEIGSHNTQMQPALALAWAAPWMGLKLGVTGMLVTMNLDTEIALSFSEAAFAEAEHPGYDARVHLDAGSPWTPAVVLGFSLEPTPWFTVAASVQPGFDLEVEGTADVTLAREIDAIVDVEGDRVKGGLKLPTIARMALQAHDPARTWDAELAFVWEGWSRNEAIDFVPQDIVIRSVVPALNRDLGTVSIRYEWRDAMSVRLGGSYAVVPEKVLARAGLFYERGTVDAAHTSPSSFDLDKVGVAGGARVELPYGLWADLGLAYIQSLSRTVDDSEIRLVNVLADDPDERSLWPIGNGEYSNWQLVTLVALGGTFDL